MTQSVGQRLIDGAADPAHVLLEGFHAVKHARRFGAALELVAVSDRDAALALCERLAPDMRPLIEQAEAASSEEIEAGGREVPTGVVGLAQRPPHAARELASAPGLLVVLEAPRNPANVGAAIRASAAAHVGGVATTGEQDPWHPAAVRGSAGLHFAQPVAHGSIADVCGQRPAFGLDPDGELLSPADLPADAALVFGTERDGLSAQARARCERLVRLPMREGVSSLNLATSVSATLMAIRLANGWEGGEAP